MHYFVRMFFLFFCGFLSVVYTTFTPLNACSFLYSKPIYYLSGLRTFLRYQRETSHSVSLRVADTEASARG